MLSHIKLLTIKVLVAQLCPTLLWPHGLQPTRLFCPWNSSGKKTGVGSHSLLQEIFSTQGSNPGLLSSMLYHLSHLFFYLLFSIVTADLRRMPPWVTFITFNFLLFHCIFLHSKDLSSFIDFSIHSDNLSNILAQNLNRSVLFLQVYIQVLTCMNNLFFLLDIF